MVSTANARGSPGHDLGGACIRTLTTSHGNLVLHEAGLLCPVSGTAQVKAVWAADGTDSTGTFAAATGQGTDTAYPQKYTAAPHGTLTLAP